MQGPWNQVIFFKKLLCIYFYLKTIFFSRFTEDSLYFKGTALPDNKLHEVTIKFFSKIIPDKVEQKTSRIVDFVIPKAESGPYWPSLLSEKQKAHWLKVDFNKWNDGSDDDEEEPEGGGDKISDLIRQVGNLDGGEKPSFNDLDDDQEDSDDDEMPNLA